MIKHLRSAADLDAGTATRSPAKSLRPGSRSRTCRRRLNASSRAWVGCSWVPSPALTTCASTHCAA